MAVTIYHNPRCSKSRATMEYLEENGIEAEVIKYMDTPPDAAALKELLTMLNMSPRELMRKHETVFKDAGLDDPTFTDEELIEAMTQCPSLIERPIVVNNGKAVLARPPEAVLDIL
jgi:arsenate reductase